MDSGSSSRQSPQKKEKSLFLKKYGHQLTSPSKNPTQAQDVGNKNVEDLLSGEEFTCGASIVFPNSMLHIIHSFCFLCGRKFETYVDKINHMQGAHNFHKNTKICRVCFSYTNSPLVHIHKVKYSLKTMFESSNADDEEAQSEEDAGGSE